MSFDVPADAYGSFMGRWSEPLASRFAALLGLAPGQRAVDVGCGPGALTTVLVERLGAGNVIAVDPSEPFVAALRHRLPDVDVRRAPAEDLPLESDSVDVAAAQLVVHFMRDPVAGVREMARVTRPAGLVAACVWDHGGGSGPLSVFWRAVASLDPGVPDESGLTGSREGDLERVLNDAGLTDVTGGVLTVRRQFAGLDEWWEPFTLGVGPAGAYVGGLDAPARRALRERCGELLSDGPFELDASAWCAVGRVAG